MSIKRAAGDNETPSYIIPAEEIKRLGYGDHDRPMIETHKGLVVALREHNGYDDSDFYAVVWNAEKGAPEEVLYGSTACWTYINGATVDATPEVMAAYLAYCERARIAKASIRQWESEFTVRKGATAEVFKGRKVAVGTRGTVIWMGESFYGTRVGLKDASGTVHWTAESNVRVILEGDVEGAPKIQKTARKSRKAAQTAAA